MVRPVSGKALKRVANARNQSRLPSGDAKILSLLSLVTDPEIPVLSIEEMGILRGAWNDHGTVLVELTPTYSGCPAIDQIADDILIVLRDNGYSDVEIQLALSPVWTTDWMSEESKKKLSGYGIAPPCQTTKAGNVTWRVRCPQCRSFNTSMISQFGSTACKALWKCVNCQEPFDYFKPY